ncbi:hypothetical protein HNR46_004119 [Haloferula luteola]|uniref:Uncharacterized protein n=2 Tax=Haloferula luteola TaxID=595692 RepID=A0A840V760_9BACT|nr:hypothetical protein [Haloferula luteola]
MTIRRILGENGPMDALCSGGQCPAFIIADNGNAYVQGKKLKQEERANLSAPEGEDFVAIPLLTLRKIAAQVGEA